MTREGQKLLNVLSQQVPLSQRCGLADSLISQMAPGVGAIGSKNSSPRQCHQILTAQKIFLFEYFIPSQSKLATGLLLVSKYGQIDSYLARRSPVAVWWIQHLPYSELFYHILESVVLNYSNHVNGTDAQMSGPSDLGIEHGIARKAFEPQAWLYAPGI
ncbi:hypothetical protein Ddc_15674 [Ditylenchus destructor]|nr:hypothetical protein Ddc_15674 [Ditylenchus destructor]